ncbi:D-glycero-D-manno-heptose 1,7-bisphosphate phosphatase [Selenomonas ruminantium]|uniref:D,D-heptose 1,7-bisphosphate phosphatase n=1 Tax=Selenomonas ruminantium TaxID=971 RepID=A0A1M6TFJ7_SELRU|nr:HAD family hydrolase [Selenomonas ruminantium]SHK55659.1 D-glycero-D-manno-heptose 1,7-bisphosphate phosphatase [Selenomonas ruminantium]
MTTTNKAKAVFFDRDGTLNVDTEYLHRTEDFIWIEDAREAIKYVNDRGYLAILATNQSGVARGYYPEEDVKIIYDWMNQDLAKIGAHLDALYYCPHHPQGPLPAYRKVCTCRKPDTGMIDEACKRFHIDRSQSYFVGDSDRDMECAQRAGLTGIRYVKGSLLERIKAIDTSVKTLG